MNLEAEINALMAARDKDKAEKNEKAGRVAELLSLVAFHLHRNRKPKSTRFWPKRQRRQGLEWLSF